MFRKLAMGVLATACAWSAGPALAQDYVMHGRVSYDAGNTLIKGAEDSEYGYAATNTLVLPGDVIWVDQGGATEMEFAGGSFLRVADGSKTEIVALPPSATIRAWTGSLYIHRLSRSTGGFVVQTPAAAIEVGSDAQVRIDVVDQGATTVSVRWGRAEIRTDHGGGTIVNAGERAWVDPGYLPSEAVAFDRNRMDSFDEWNRERAEFLATGGATPGPTGTPVIQEPVIGASELNRYGEWVYVDSRPYWRPTVIVDYVPYRYGRWNYVPAYGHVWSGHYPFSYVTSHYGRWRHTSTYGWIWSYDPVWSPAWAATIRVGDYFAWAPIGYDYRPVLVSGHSYFTVGGVRFSFFSTSYAPATGIYYGPSYIHPVHPGFYRYVNDNYGTINIWNININSDRRVPVPYERDVFNVRDYNPNRSIRSTSSFRDGGALAVDRARSLESRSGRSQFSSVDRTGGRGARTVLDTSARESRVRDVRLTREAPSYTRATREAPEVASRDAVRGIRGGGTSALESRSGSVDRSRSDRDGITEAPSRTVGAPDRSNAGRDVRGATPDRDSNVSTDRVTRTPGSGEAGARERAVGRTPGGTESRSGEVTRTPSVRQSAPERGPATTPRSAAPSGRSEAGNAPMRTPRGGASVEGPGRSFRVDDGNSNRTTIRGNVEPQTPQRSVGTSPRSTSTEGLRSAPNRTTTPIQGGRTEGNIRGGNFDRSAPSVQRSAPDRSGPTVRQTTPQRSAPSIEQRSAPSVQRSAPSIEQRSAPSVQRSAPSIEQRSAPSVQRSAPSIQQRSAPSVQQRSAPSVQRSAPSVQRSAPSFQQRSAPSVQRSAPSVQRRSAPSVQRAPSAPSVQRSAPSINRGGSSRGSSNVRGGR